MLNLQNIDLKKEIEELNKFPGEETGSKRATTKETKCMFKGDPYHEFIIDWE